MSEQRDSVVLDAKNLRGIAHPVRVRLLGLLRADGPSTATRLGARLGLSSAATSYHLRQLHAHGFLVDDPAASKDHGRERWWRVAQRTSTVDMTADPAAVAAGEEYLRAVAAGYGETMLRWIDEAPSAPPAWQAVSDMSDTRLLLTPAQARALGERFAALVAELPRAAAPGRRPRGARPVAVQWQVLPRLGERP